MRTTRAERRHISSADIMLDYYGDSASDGHDKVPRGIGGIQSWGGQSLYVRPEWSYLTDSGMLAMSWWETSRCPGRDLGSSWGYNILANAEEHSYSARQLAVLVPNVDDAVSIQDGGGQQRRVSNNVRTGQGCGGGGGGGGGGARTPAFGRRRNLFDCLPQASSSQHGEFVFTGRRCDDPAASSPRSRGCRRYLAMRGAVGAEASGSADLEGEMFCFLPTAASIDAAGHDGATAALHRQVAKRNANSKSNVSSARCCWVNGEGFANRNAGARTQQLHSTPWTRSSVCSGGDGVHSRPGTAREWNPSFSQWRESKHPRRPEDDGCCGAFAVQAASSFWNGAIWPLGSVQACPGVRFAGVDTPRDAVGDSGRFDWGVRTTQRNLQKKKRIHRSAARSNSAWTGFWVGTRGWLGAEDPWAAANQTHGMDGMVHANCWLHGCWTGLGWMTGHDMTMAVPSCSLGADAVGHEECARHVARCEGLGRAAGQEAGEERQEARSAGSLASALALALTLAGRRGDPPAGEALCATVLAVSNDDAHDNPRSPGRRPMRRRGGAAAEAEAAGDE
ncbi:hypothetical protein PMIN01_01626 [Paraphaeosphaeria minitans]|uniref:Uncharacterized protein n=1 Tax=Paraphaeosphaeria minitans TaxID=565426 RepID=A0A9P6GNK2_9PLEO|nr:hypothetical protein PMIN01_01626 [Paraphaeosphaeria minitans]